MNQVTHMNQENQVRPRSFSPTEQEAIVLYAVCDMIDEMVNFEMFKSIVKFENTNLLFKTSSNARLFNILLADFLSAPSRGRNPAALPFDLPKIHKDKKLSDTCFLYYLELIVAKPAFAGDIAPLRKAVSGFKHWLDTECFVPNVWLSSIGIEVGIRAARFTLLKICGNIAKHNFSRLNVTVSEIREILAYSGQDVDEQQAFIALQCFYARFHDGFFIYHSSTIAEYLNNIRWAIHRYLEPQLVGADPRYSFTYPESVEQPLARGMYWDLMTRVMRQPNFPEFSVSGSLKAQY